MARKSRFLAHAAQICALYAALCFLQNVILPGSASWVIQLRVAESLCIFALFTPAAIPGLAAGCMLFNLSCAGALPLDFLIGSLATALSAGSMWLSRKVTLRGYPLPALLMPGIFNGLFVGWELSIYIGGLFWINTLYVAVGEWLVLLTLGSALYCTLKARRLHTRLFG